LASHFLPCPTVRWQFRWQWVWDDHRCRHARIERPRTLLIVPSGNAAVRRRRHAWVSPGGPCPARSTLAERRRARPA
jgi:hypothetical protein